MEQSDDKIQLILDTITGGIINIISSDDDVTIREYWARYKRLMLPVVKLERIDGRSNRVRHKHDASQTSVVKMTDPVAQVTDGSPQNTDAYNDTSVFKMTNISQAREASPQNTYAYSDASVFKMTDPVAETTDSDSMHTDISRRLSVIKLTNSVSQPMENTERNTLKYCETSVVKEYNSVVHNNDSIPRHTDTSNVEHPTTCPIDDSTWIDFNSPLRIADINEETTESSEMCHAETLNDANVQVVPVTHLDVDTIEDSCNDDSNVAVSLSPGNEIQAANDLPSDDTLLSLDKDEGTGIQGNNTTFGKVLICYLNIDNCNW